jgi:hypothetical protein
MAASGGKLVVDAFRVALQSRASSRGAPLCRRDVNDRDMRSSGDRFAGDGFDRWRWPGFAERWVKIGFSFATGEVRMTQFHC